MNDMKKINIKNITLSAMFIALGLVLPFITGQIPQIGSMMLPMHIPVLLLGLICGWKYGLAVGFITPVLRSFMFGMPPLFPSAIAMAFELAVYGFVIGLLFNKIKWKCIYTVFFSLFTAMICGRVAWGLVSMLFYGILGKGFTWQMFMAGAFVNAIPGIILQLVLIPSLMALLNRTGMVRFTHRSGRKNEGIGSNI
jgi:thiamine transporter ThiT